MKDQYKFKIKVLINPQILQRKIFFTQFYKNQFTVKFLKKFLRILVENLF